MHIFSYCGLVGWDAPDYNIDEDIIIYKVLVVFN